MAKAATTAPDTKWGSIVQELSDKLGGAQSASDKADKAKAAAGEATANSIRDVASFLRGINEDLGKEDIAEIAGATAEKIAKGNPTVKKARKSEITLMLEQRAHMATLVTEIDKMNKEGEARLNMRTQVLSGLRKIRKDPDLTPTDYVNDLRETLGVKENMGPVDKMVAAVDRVAANKAITDKNGSPPAEVIAAAQALKEAMQVAYEAAEAAKKAKAAKADEDDEQPDLPLEDDDRYDSGLVGVNLADLLNGG